MTGPPHAQPMLPASVLLAGSDAPLSVQGEDEASDQGGFLQRNFSMARRGNTAAPARQQARCCECMHLHAACGQPGPSLRGWPANSIRTPSPSSACTMRCRCKDRVCDLTSSLLSSTRPGPDAPSPVHRRLRRTTGAAASCTAASAWCVAGARRAAALTRAALWPSSRGPQPPEKPPRHLSQVRNTRLLDSCTTC